MQPQIRLHVLGVISQQKQEAMDNIESALNDFLVSDNPAATLKNNILQQRCSEARKVVLGIQSNPNHQIITTRTGEARNNGFNYRNG